MSQNEIMMMTILLRLIEIRIEIARLSLTIAAL